MHILCNSAGITNLPCLQTAAFLHNGNFHLWLNFFGVSFGHIKIKS